MSLSTQCGWETNLGTYNGGLCPNNFSESLVQGLSTACIIVTVARGAGEMLHRRITGEISPHVSGTNQSSLRWSPDSQYVRSWSYMRTDAGISECCQHPFDIHGNHTVNCRKMWKKHINSIRNLHVNTYLVVSSELSAAPAAPTRVQCRTPLTSLQKGDSRE